MKTLRLAVFLLALVPSIALAQSAPIPSAPTVAPVTEVESLRMQVAGMADELFAANEAKRKAESERDQLRLQVVMLTTAPQRPDHAYDWGVGKFRHLVTGMVWDFEQKKYVADGKTPKADKAGGGTP